MECMYFEKFTFFEIGIWTQNNSLEYTIEKAKAIIRQIIGY